MRIYGTFRLAALAAALSLLAAPLYARQPRTGPQATPPPAARSELLAHPGDAPAPSDGFWRVLGWRLEHELRRIAPMPPGASNASSSGSGDPARDLARRIDLTRALARGSAAETGEPRPPQPPQQVLAALDRLSYTLRRAAARGDRVAPPHLQGELWLQVDELGRRLDASPAAGDRDLAAAPSTAGLTTGGSISGTVTEDPSGTPLADVFVTILDAAGAYVSKSQTSSTGTYSATGLPAGTYYAWADSATHVSEIYDDVTCLPYCDSALGTPIAVSDGAATTGIDFALRYGGSITGTVTEDGTGDPLSGVAVIVRDANNGAYAIGTTLADGTYTAGGLPTGTYYATTFDDDYLDELYDDLVCPASCDPTLGTSIAVTLGATTSGIDFSLSSGGAVTGTITDAATGVPLPGIYVDVRADSGDSISGAFTGSDGAYVVGGLPTGTVYAETYNPTYVDEIYDDVTCTGFCSIGDGTPIAVTVAMVTTGIDFQLAIGGGFEGSVTDATTGAPLYLVIVKAYDAAGAYRELALTDAAGNYTLGGLPTGTYYALTRNNPTYFDELFDDIRYTPGDDETAGTAISVTAGTSVPNVDFDLEVGGTLAGTVLDATTLAPVSDVWVILSDGAGHSVWSERTASDGTYLARPLTAGTYYARVFGTATYFGEIYEGLPASLDPADGTALSVSEGVETTGIDFRLDPRDPDCSAQEDLYLTGLTVQTTVVYEACHSIRAGSGFTVTTDGDATLRAGGPVILYPGFSVADGGRLAVVSGTDFP